jgi:hypothetical protein
VIRHGFLTIRCPDSKVIRLQPYFGAAHPGPVVVCTPVSIPDQDFGTIVAVIVPVLLQEFMAG